MVDGFGAARLCLIIETEPKEDDDVRDFGLRKAHGGSLNGRWKQGIIPTGWFVILRVF
jgi:hypothetical protein